MICDSQQILLGDRRKKEVSDRIVCLSGREVLTEFDGKNHECSIRRPERRWEDDVKMDGKDIGSEEMDFINMRMG